jgi:integrase
MAAHTMFDGRLQIYRRSDHGPWHAAARVGKKRFRQSTKVESLEQAKDVAEEWYLGLRGKLKKGEIVPDEKSFGAAAREYLAEIKVLAISKRSPSYVEMIEMRLNRHVLPYFKDMGLSTINKGVTQKYLVKRVEDTITEGTKKGEDGKPDTPGKPPARNTLLQEVVIVRQVLKHAEGNGDIKFVPKISSPYLSKTKRERRAWFDPDEYNQLTKATRRRISEGKRSGWQHEYADLHDYVLINANSGLRPDEASNLEFRDVKVEADYGTKKTILVIDVRGKTGTGYCKSTPNAVYPFEQLRVRRIQRLRDQGKSEDEIEKLLPQMKVFPKFRRDLFNEILREEGLNSDRDGRPRTAYSLRHTYISMRLMEGANIYQVANNCRTSVEMIQDFYAAHIKNRIDASAINVERSRAAKKADRDAARAQKNPRLPSPEAPG